MAALALPPSTVTFTGAVGVLSGMAVTAVEAADQPTSLRAERVKEYILPFFKPVIIGAGAIALEFASMWNAAGSQVTLLVRGRVPDGGPLSVFSVVSSAGEVIVAAHSGLKVLGISCITNFAAGFQEELNHEEVVEVTERVKGDFKGLLKAILAAL